MTIRKIALFLLLAVCVAGAATMLRAQSGAGEQDTQNGMLDVLADSRRRQSERVEGSWDVIVTPAVPPGVPQPPSFHAYATFARGGASTGAGRPNPFSKQFGVWEHQGGHRFAYTLKEDLFDALGNFTGVTTVRARFTLTGRDEFVGVANAEQRDTNGNVVAIRCSTIRASRIGIEPLADQCQNITPPQ